MNSRITQVVLLALLVSWSINPLFAAQCKSTVYLTFDTGSQSQAGLIADTLKKHEVKATFFLANEKTVKGDSSLEQGWASFWKQLLAEGHVFGSHTFDHVYLRGDGSNGTGLQKQRHRAATWKTGPRPRNKREVKISVRFG